MIAKRIKMTKSCTLAINDCKENIFADCRELLKKNHFTDNEIALFLGQVIDVLYIYREKFGNEKELKYTVRKHFKNIECILVIKGEQVNPFEEGTEFSTKMLAEKALKPLLVNETDQITHIYSAGWNRVTISSPQIHSKSIFSSPMFLSVMMYRLLTANYNAAYGALQVGLEQIESAKRFNAIDLVVLRSSLVKKDE